MLELDVSRPTRYLTPAPSPTTSSRPPSRSPPSAANQNLTCDLLVAGGGLSGLSAAEAAIRRGLDVVVIEKGAYGKDAASGLNAGQFLTGWAKSVDVMLAELAQQELRGGATGEMARARAERRVRAFLRRTVEGCLGLAELDRRYNLRASVQHGAVTAAMNETDMASLRAAYEFMEKSSLRALMPADDKRRPPSGSAQLRTGVLCCSVRGPSAAYETMSLSFLSGRTLTTLRAGLALKIVSSFVKRLMPFRSLVAGLCCTTVLHRPGRAKFFEPPRLRDFLI